MNRERQGWFIAGSCILLILLVALINPLKETAFLDDWANADTVRHLLQTGEYRLNDWLAPNMLFQAYWGALFSKIFGYSFATLRISTLALSALGVVGFYFLAREHGFETNHAALLTLIFLSSPLWFGLSFTFLTDVPFIALMIVATWLYTRSIRLRSLGGMIAASVAASAAILTRQFGIMLLVGLAGVWATTGNRRENFRLIVAGMILPAIATVWLIWQSVIAPSWAATYSTVAMRDFMANPVYVAAMLFWRVMATFQYLALFSLPLALAALWELGSELKNPVSLVDPRRSARFTIATLTSFVVFFALAGLIGAFALGMRSYMPLLIALFSFIETWPAWLAAMLTLITFVGGVMLGRLFALRYFAPQSGWRNLPAHERLLDVVLLGLFVGQLPFIVYPDRYVMALVPYALIAAGKILAPWSNRLRWPVAALAAFLLCATGLWTRALLDEGDARWRLADSLVAEGVDPKHVSASWDWDSYTGALDTYLAEVDYRVDQIGFADYLGRWWPEYHSQAEYIIVTSETISQYPGYAVARGASYQSMLFQPERMVILKRPSP